MKFSIITPTYRRPKQLERAIASVLDQTIGDWEMIIVNDDPNDGTKELVASYNDDRIIFLENEVNAGVNASRNRALDNVARDSDHIVFLDDDDWLPNDSLVKLARIIVLSPAPWIVTARGTNDTTPNTSAPASSRHYSYLWDYLVLRRLQGDATHCIDSAFINGTRARIRFPISIRQAEEWLFYCELGTYTQLYFEKVVTTLTDGYQTGGLNLRKRTFKEQIFTIPTLIREARGRHLYHTLGFWIYIMMRIIRAVIK